jgi:THO complex subunit 4
LFVAPCGSPSKVSPSLHKSLRVAANFHLCSKLSTRALHQADALLLLDRPTKLRNVLSRVSPATFDTLVTVTARDFNPHLSLTSHKTTSATTAKMPDKLNQSLDQIMSDRRKTTRKTRARPGVKTPTAPSGGVSKKVKPAERKAPNKAVPTGPANRESKVQVSNLPRDVNEVQIKEYFTTTVGAIKKVLLSYGPNGESRGLATIVFARTDGAAKAAKELNGLKVDGRPMKIEVIVDASRAPAPTAPKSLGDRIQKPAEKAKPKPATAAPRNAAGKEGAKNGRARRGGKGEASAGRVGRPKPKTTEELDAEMADYFVNGAGSDAALANGGAVHPAAAGGDVGMEEDVVA